MPRKPLIYTHEHPYHIMARSNNKDWFYIPKADAWLIFKTCLNEARQRFGFRIHLFVLMDNHYHMIGQCSEKHNLGEVMAWLQKTISRNINSRAGKINHVFGGPYKACLIRHPEHFSSVFKYVARNPVVAGISASVSSYQYLTINNKDIITEGPTEWFSSIPSLRNDFYDWLEKEMDSETRFFIKSSLSKTVFADAQVVPLKKKQLEFPIIR